MEDSDNISEVEVFRSEDSLLVDQICEALKDADIEYLKIPIGSAIDGFMKIYAGVYYDGYKIIVLREKEEKAKEIVDSISSTYIAENYTEEIPEELKEYEEENDEENDEENE